MLKDKVFIALGGNIGAVPQTFDQAIGRLRSDMKILKVSSYYRAKPAGFTQQNDFYNAAILVHYHYQPIALLDILQKTEKKFGKKFIHPNGPRSLDLDIVFWGNKTFSSSKLIIPHPRVFVRDFVLVPCAEIAPHYIPVGKTKTLAELVANIDKKNGYLINRIKRN